jgi:tripartite-type tricarboxylate transporter receptor subunit TctC
MKKVLVGLLVLIVAISAVFAQGSKEIDLSKYPERDIRVIVAFNPGGQTDLISRKIAEIVDKYNLANGKTIVTVNMPGGNTLDAINATMEADLDGYTFFMHHSNLVTNYVMGNLSVRYDEMELGGGIVDQGFGIVKRSNDNRWANVQELVEYVKKHPGEVTCGFPGFASPGHFALLQFAEAAGIAGMIKEVPYGGGAEAIKAHLGGEVDLRATNMGDSARYVASGDIEFLCMVSQDPNKDYPTVPTLKSFGSDMEGLQLHTGIFAPKGTPKEIVEKFMSIVHTACDTTEFKEFAAGMRNTIALRNGEEFKAVYDIDLKNITEIAKTLRK